ncbi:MAG TPA: radical SAM protein [Thermoanaerobaculales bacterium]|nr:radical SAM protein [Thermoanaerobaculales bacterium]HQL31169.1 radical SAM protein [Thermoanaerobaculales bacterium]
MRVLVVAGNTERINLPTLPLGAALVAAAAAAHGHDVAFLDLMGEADPELALRREIGVTRPDAIGVSVRNIDDQEMARPAFLLDKVRPLIAACRSASAAPVILGGAGFTLFPEAVLRYLDADLGVCGEGEEAFPALLDRLEIGSDAWDLPGVFGPGHRPAERRAAVADLDTLPEPGPRLWASADVARPDVWVPVQTRRGCPFRCSYCSTPLIEGCHLRCRSPQLVAEQLARMAAAGVQRVQFVDNVFNIPRDHVLALCRRISALDAGVEWQCIVYPSRLDEELVSAMAEAGCRAVSLGFESGDDRMLRAYRKHFNAAEVRRVSELLAGHGIGRFGFLLLGGPGETRASVTASLDFAQSLGLDLLRVTVGVRIYPGTELADAAQAEHVIARDDDLLRPRFYMTPDLEAWIHDELAQRGIGAGPRI